MVTHYFEQWSLFPWLNCPMTKTLWSGGERDVVKMKREGRGGGNSSKLLDLSAWFNEISNTLDPDFTQQNA